MHSRIILEFFEKYKCAGIAFFSWKAVLATEPPGKSVDLVLETK